MADSYLNTLEGLLSLGSGAVAQPVSGLGGLLALAISGDSKKSAQAVKNIQETLTYAPKTEEGQRFVEDIAGLLAPVGEAIEGAQTGAGDYVFDKTGSPLAGALTQAVVGGAPDIAGGLLGAKALPKGKSYTMGDIGTQASKFGGKQRGVFAGVEANTADKFMLGVAEKMESQGIDPKTIWQKTGWGRGADNKWRFEIDDSASTLTPEASGLFFSGNVREGMSHPNISGLYADELGGIDLNIMPQREDVADTTGLWHPKVNRDSEGLSTIDEYILLNSPEDLTGRRTALLHEVQHGIQSREGFASGGNVQSLYEAIMDKNKRLEPKIKEINDNMSFISNNIDMVKASGQDAGFLVDAYNDLIREKMDLVDQYSQNPIDDAYSQYKALSGEVEARNVEKRADMSYQDRRSTPFWETQDTPNDDQIITEPTKDVATSQSTDYRIDHTAPVREGANSIDDMSDIYPDDVYDPRQSAQYYGHGGDSKQMDAETAMIIAGLRDKPNATVTIYRAVPKGVKDINVGDWVTVNKNYAKSHGDSWVDGGEYDIISKKVKAKDIVTDGNSIHEFGYDPEVR